MRRFVAVPLVLCAGVLPACGGGSSIDTTLRQGREAYVAGDFVRAGELFGLAGEQASGSPQALLGVARARHQLHDYAAALSGYEKVLALAPDDSLAWQGYLDALYEGGVYEGNGARLEAVLRLAPTALERAPHNVEVYGTVQRAAAELDRLDEYVSILQGAVEKLPADPVPRIELSRVRLEKARRARNLAVDSVAAEASATLVDELEAELHADLESTAAGAGGGAGVPARVCYKLAVGYTLLGDATRADEWLEALESTEAGRRMAAPARYAQFLGDWVASFDTDPATRIGLVDRWLPRFEPEWNDSGRRYRTILGMQFDVMVAAAREALADGTGGPGNSGDLGGAGDLGGPGNSDDAGDLGDRDPAGTVIGEQQADLLARVGRRLARTDSGRGAARFVQTVSVLARVPSHWVDAVRIADDGIDALRENRPGMIRPGASDDEHAEIARRYTALLMQLQGQALHKLGRADDAEDALRGAITVYPAAASYAVLGGLLLEQQRDAEALDLLVSALARGFEPSEGALEEETRAAALDAAARAGATPEEVSEAVAAAADRIDEERRLEILADPLDLAAPDFELEGTDGDTWRLSDLAGNVVVLNYWATWCAPCIAELPYYQSLVDEYREAPDVVFLAISTDSDPSVVAPFIDGNGYAFDVLYDRGSAVDFEVSGVPAGFLIGKDGRIMYRTSGFPGPERYLREMRLRIEALRAAGQ